MTDIQANDALKPTLALLIAGKTLNQQQAYDAFSIIMTGGADDSQIASLLSLIQSRGTTVDELTGAARVMREHVSKVPIPEHLKDTIIDTCGTGGAPKTFNISTAAAIVAAGAGAKVAKHGNRSRTGRGSAEILQALGVNLDASPETQAKCLEIAGVSFSFAVNHHPAIKYAMPARRALGFPTIYNLLGPLTNPAGANRQLIGVYAPQYTELLARTLCNLGCKRAMIVHGNDGLDEITTTTTTKISDVRDGAVNCTTINPASLNINPAKLVDLQATNLDSAVTIFKDILNGIKSPYRDITIINAAAALVIADIANDIPEAVNIAGDAIDTGAARRALDTLIEVSHLIK